MTRHWVSLMVNKKIPISRRNIASDHHRRTSAICDVYVARSESCFCKVRYAINQFKTRARGASVIIYSSIFALSIDHHLLGGYLWVVIMVLISFGGIYQSAAIANASED